MKKDEKSEKIKEDQTDALENDQDLLKKRQDTGDEGSKSVRIVMPSVPGPYISKEEFIGLQKTELGEVLIQKYYDRYKTLYKEEETRYYIDQHQDDIWFNDLYNPYTGQKLEEIKLQNNLKKHRLFIECLNDDWIRDFDASSKDLGVDADVFKQNTGYKYVEGVSGSILKENLQRFYGESEYVVDGFPKDASVSEIWTQFADKEWFWGLDTSLPIKHNNYTRVVYLTRNPLRKDIEHTSVASLEISNYSFKIHEYMSKVFDINIKSYGNADEVKKDINSFLGLITAITTKHQLTIDSFSNALTPLSSSKKLSILIYYLWIVWGIDVISKTKQDRNTLRKRILVTNANDIAVEDGYVPEPTENPAYASLIESITVEGSEDRLGVLVDTKLDAKIKDMLEEYEEGVWPCPKCGKFFENADYVVKHFGQKHQDKMEKYRVQLKLEVKSSDFTAEKYKNILIGNYENRINFNPFKDAIVYREMEKLKDRQALKLNYRWRYIEDY